MTTGHDSAPVLEVRDLRVSFDTPDGVVRAVNGVSFDLRRGETLGIVGESGSGKSVTASSIMRLNSTQAAHTSGSILLDGVDMLQVTDREMRAMRGKDVAMVFQDPMSALNPYFTVGDQIAEAYLVHNPGASKSEAREITVDMMRRVGIPGAEARVDEYPHQFSGGMRQRIVIAIALVNQPKVLIADEPTTALDVTVQAQILELMLELQAQTQMAIILITHDLGVVAETADNVVVMYGGRIAETADVQALFDQPVHPYTWGLLGAVRSIDDRSKGALRTIQGTPPSLITLPAGCAFHPRCPFADSLGEPCRTVVPELTSAGSKGSSSACHLPVARRVALSKAEER